MHVVVQKKNKELWNYSWQVAVGHINHVCACQKNRPPPPQATPYTPLFCSLLLAISVRHIAQLKPQPSRQKLKPSTAYLPNRTYTLFLSHTYIIRWLIFFFVPFQSNILDIFNIKWLESSHKCKKNQRQKSVTKEKFAMFLPKKGFPENSSIWICTVS